MTTQIHSDKAQQIPDLIAELKDSNSLLHQHARFLLVHRAQESIPALLDALKNPDTNVRLGAVKALGEIHSPETAAPIADLLMDNDIGVRWAAMESLIRMGRSSLKPVLEKYIKNFDSLWMREGVHHILHVLKDRHQLKVPEITLFLELDKQAFPGFESGWNPEQAWAAERALELLDRQAEIKRENNE